MMTSKITMMVLIVGVVVGAAATEGFHVYRQAQDNNRQSHDRRIFQERLHCKTVADDYVKKESTNLKETPTDPNAVVLTLHKVDYSPARNSCVAEVDTTRYFSGGGDMDNVSVQDLLSGEILAASRCDDVCGMRGGSPFIDSVFDYAMNNASKPTELIQAEAVVESKYPPKPTPTPKERERRRRELEALMGSKNTPK